MTIIKQRALQFFRLAARLTRQDVSLIIAIMIVARLLAIVALRPGGYVVETGPDGAYYFDWGRLAAGGAYPLLDYWTEYPPIFPWLSVLAYKLAVLLPAWIDQRFWFNLILHSFMIPFDAGNIALIYVLARRIHGHDTALKAAWLYVALFVPLFVLLGWFESIALFAALLSIWAILSNRPILAGIVLGFGILVKQYVAIAGVIGLVQLRPKRQLFKFIFAGLIILAVGLGPFLLKSPQLIKANIDSMLTRPAWSSPYALIDGITTYSPIALADRFDPAQAINPTPPTRIPWALVTLAFGLVYAFTLIRSHPHRTVRAAIGLTGLTFTLFFLWSKGYSPQWSLFLMACLCILLPDRLGGLLLISLEIFFVLEWPVTTILLAGNPGYLAALVVLRTLNLMGLAILFAAMIFIKPTSFRWQRVRHWSKIGGTIILLAITGLAIGAVPIYAAQRYQNEPMRDAIELIRSTSTPDRASVLFDRVDTYERLNSYLPGWSTLAALQIGGPVETWDEARIQAFATEQPELWYMLDNATGTNKDARLAIDRRLTETLCKVSSQFAGSAQISHFINASPTISLSTVVNFADGINLTGARITSLSLAADAKICIELHWSASQTPSTDYTVFVHVLNRQGQLVSQSDLQPDGGFAPTSQWQPNTLVIDRHGIILPAGLTSGTYHIVIGLYAADGTRLKNDATQSPEPDSVLLADFTLQ
jgi:Glycosyltransferase family 87